MSMERFPPLANAPMQYLCKGNLLFKLENIIHLIISRFVRILRNSKQKNKDSQNCTQWILIFVFLINDLFNIYIDKLLVYQLVKLKYRYLHSFFFHEIFPNGII